MSAPLLNARKVTKRFGGLVALREVDIQQGPTETLGMIGPNGSGKTTFINCMTGHLRPESGSIAFDDSDLIGARPHQVSAVGLTRTYQAVRVFQNLTVQQNIDTALLDCTRRSTASERVGLIALMRLEWLLEKRTGSLTLFEQRRLEILMRLMQRPKLMMLDEPVGGLSSVEVRQMIALLNELKGRCAIFVIEHTMKVIRELADRVVVLLAGEKIADGAPAEVLRDARVIEQYLGGGDA